MKRYVRVGGSLRRRCVDPFSSLLMLVLILIWSLAYECDGFLRDLNVIQVFEDGYFEQQQNRDGEEASNPDY